MLKYLLSRLHDWRVYFLIAPALAVLYALDPVIAGAWVHLLVGVPLLAGIALSVRRFLFHVDVSKASDIAMQAPTGAGLVVLADRLFTACVLVGGLLWLSR